MAKGTVSRDEIREHLKEDELSEALKSLLAFIQKHSRSLTFALVALIAAVAVWKLIQYRESKAVENSNMQMVEAQQKYTQAVFSMKLDAKKRADLLDQALNTLETVRRVYPGTPAARLSLYLEGNTYLAMKGKEGSTDPLEKARETFRQYADTATTGEDKARGLLGLGAAYENIGWLNKDNASYQKGEDAYREVLKAVSGGSYLAIQAKLHLARLLASQGDTAKAAGYYREIIKTVGQPETAKNQKPALTSAERQHRKFDKAVLGILDQFSYAEIAKQELDAIAPPSANALDLKRPPTAPAAEKPAAESTPSAK